MGLCVLVGGPEARELDGLDAVARRNAVLGSLTRYLGAEILEPASWHEKSWHLDENVGGGYLSLPDLGSTHGIVPVTSDPVGNIYWAGTETADDHAGHFEGAIDGVRGRPGRSLKCWLRGTQPRHDPGQSPIRSYLAWKSKLPLHAVPGGTSLCPVPVSRTIGSDAAGGSGYSAWPVLWVCWVGVQS